MRNVLITGAGDGVGKAIAEILKEENLLLIDKEEENLKSTAQALNCKYYLCDMHFPARKSSKICGRKFFKYRYTYQLRWTMDKGRNFSA